MEPDDEDDLNVDRSAIGEARYSNYAQIGHNASEFIFDFGQGWVDEKPIRVYVRVVTTPDMAEEIYDQLCKALSQYRVAFGEIRRGKDADEL